MSHIAHTMHLITAGFVFAAVTASFAVESSDPARVIHVSPSACGAGDGTAERPFASPREALEFLRANRPKGAVAVSFASGEYELSEPIVLRACDSGEPGAPVTWRGPADGSAKFVGARTLSGWRVREDGRWETDAPRGADGRPQWFEQLFVNGRRAQRARHPNSGFLAPQSVTLGNATNRTQSADVTAKDGDLAVLASADASALAFAHIVVHHKWDTSRRVIRGFVASNSTVKTIGPALPQWNSWNVNSTYYVENVPDALDAPGEWLYDGVAGKIVYIPLEGEKPGDVRVQYPVPGMIHLLKIEGDPRKGEFVHDVVFENLCFQFSDSPSRASFSGSLGIPEAKTGGVPAGPGDWAPSQAAAHTLAAVIADGGHRITWRGCEVSHVGEYGVWLRGGCVSNRIENCTISDLGAGGVRIGLPRATQPVGKGERVTGLSNSMGSGWNVVDNCVISHGGRYHASGVGVWVGSSPFNSITHCEISDFFYTGVSVGWVWGYAGSLAQGNTIAFCRIRDIGQRALSDMGGVYTLGTSYGTCISNNVISSVDSRTYGGWGLYPDEGSEGIVFENNLVYDTKDASFHQHYGKDNVLRNNILAFSREGQIGLTRAEEHLSFTAERNIVYWNDGPVFRKYKATLNETGRINWVDNFWWMEGGVPSFNGKTFAEWQAKGNDVHGLCADPLFVDAARRDFRLRPESPVVAAGFRPFDISAAGPRKGVGQEPEVVPLLTDAQKAYLSMPADVRRAKFADRSFRKNEMALPAEQVPGEKTVRKAYWPKTVRIAWAGRNGVKYRVVVRPAGRDDVVIDEEVAGSVLHVDNLEIAREYRWSADGGGEHWEGRFRTEDAAPRLVRFPGVPNVRDLGGRIGLGGRRVKQGMVFRSGGLNNNACNVYYTEDELIALGKIEKPTPAEKDRHARKSPKRIKIPKIVKSGKTGRSRVGGKNGEYILKRFGIKTDLDLRSVNECYGMKGSPLGPSVKWVHVPSHDYGNMTSKGGREGFAKVFRVFLDEDNYPIDVHCISGQDRTGSVAYILNGLLGVDEDLLALDWETSGFRNRNASFCHRRLYDKLVACFKKAHPADTVRERLEKYVLSLGFTDEDIAKFRSIMLE